MARKIRIKHAADYTLAKRKSGRHGPIENGAEIAFSKPATEAGIPKLYTVAFEGKLLYVGITRQSIATRLRQGFVADGTTGYHGYKWKDLEGEPRLAVWVADPDSNDPKQLQLQTVEAEVAYWCRHKSGQWPAFQHEIHFHHSEDYHRSVARQIYDHAVGVSG